MQYPGRCHAPRHHAESVVCSDHPGAVTLYIYYLILDRRTRRGALPEGLACPIQALLQVLPVVEACRPRRDVALHTEAPHRGGEETVQMFEQARSCCSARVTAAQPRARAGPPHSWRAAILDPQTMRLRI